MAKVTIELEPAEFLSLLELVEHRGTAKQEIEREIIGAAVSALSGLIGPLTKESAGAESTSP